jgi:hypothetical protein
MASPSSIVNMNTMAVCLMQQNRHDEAKQTFRQAVTCLQELVGTENDSEFLQSHPPPSEIRSSAGSPMDTTDAMQSDTSNNRVKVVYGVSIEHPLCITNTSFLSASPDNLFDFYNRAFLLSSNLAAELPMVYESVATAVLLYNMALSGHGKAVRSGSSKELRRTLKLYKMSLRILQDDSSLHSEDMLHVLLLALLNNIGCIHSHFYDWQDMQECREVLYSLFASANDLTVEDYVFFSYVLLPSYHVSPVPAAA